ncbi:MAG TPA: hypothetical protein VIY73_15965 [Polyangiaceae bacterium]
MRRAILLAGLVVAAASAVPFGAKADGAKADLPLLPKTGASLSTATLPEGHVAPEPTAVPPKHIPAGERAEGMKTSTMTREQLESLRRGGNDVRFTYVSELGAKDDDQSETCLVDGGDAQSLRPSGGENADEEPKEWPSGFAQKISLTFAAGGSGSMPTGKHRRGRHGGGDEDVHAVHAERFVPGAGGHASLAIVDAWVDARSRGVRAYARSTLPLARVFVGPNGFEVYAARDGERIQVVYRAPVKPDDDPALAALVRSRLRSLSATGPDQSGASSDCGHLRVVLHARPGGGEMTTLAANAFLQPLGDAPPAPDDETPEQRANRLLGVMRQRPFQLSVSATSLGADPHPLLSVALGWTGRETTDGSGA